MKELGSSGKQALQKYAYVGALFDIKKSFDTTKIDFYCSLLIEVLERWTSDLKIDLLGKYGIKEDDIEKIVNNTGLKNNPVPLTKQDIKKIIGNRI